MSSKLPLRVQFRHLHRNVTPATGLASPITLSRSVPYSSVSSKKTFVFDPAKKEAAARARAERGRAATERWIADLKVKHPDTWRDIVQESEERSARNGALNHFKSGPQKPEKSAKPPPAPSTLWAERVKGALDFAAGKVTLAPKKVRFEAKKETKAEEPSFAAKREFKATENTATKEGTSFRSRRTQSAGGSGGNGVRSRRQDMEMDERKLRGRIRGGTSGI